MDDELWHRLRARDGAPEAERLAMVCEAHHSTRNGREGLDELPFELRQVLADAACELLETPVVELLGELRVTHAAPALVVCNAFDLDALAMKLVGGEIEALSVRERDALMARLETRGTLCSSIGEVGAWLNKLCGDLPTLKRLRAARWATIQSCLVTSDDESGAARVDCENHVLKLWCAGSSLREAVVDAGLPPEVVDALIELRVDKIERLTKSNVKTAADKLSRDDRALLWKLWEEKSDEHKADKAERAKKAERLKEALNEARALATRLASSTVIADETQRDALQTELQRILSELGMGEWQAALRAPTTPEEYAAKVTQLSAVLSSSEQELGAVVGDNYASDESVITKVHAGSAMYGFAVGMDPSECLAKAPHPLVTPPQGCELMSPSLPTRSNVEVFTSDTTASKYTSSLLSNGATITAKVHASGWGVSVDGSYGSERNSSAQSSAQSDSQTTSVIQMEYEFVPTRAFRYPADEMHLTSEVLEAALAIGRSHARARLFLEDHGSHISTGVQHFGGIFIKCGKLVATEERSTEEMANVVKREMATAFSAGASGFLVSGGGAINVGSSGTDASGEGSARTSATYSFTTSIMCYGPKIEDKTMFASVLTANNQTWYLIDRGDLNQLVPVWYLLERTGDEDLAAAGKLLCNVWLDLVRKSPFLDQIGDLVYRARCTNGGLIGLGSKTRMSEPLTVSGVLVEVETLCSFDIAGMDAHMLEEKVKAVFATIDVFDCQSEICALEKALKQGGLPDLLKRIAGVASQSWAAPTLDFLSSRFDEFTLNKLKSADPPVTLGKEIATVLQDMNPPYLRGTVWYPPSVAIHDLPAAMRAMEEGIDRAGGDIELLRDRIGRLLSVNLWIPAQMDGLHDVFRTVAGRYLSSRDGFGIELSRPSIHSLIEDMEKAALDFADGETRQSVGGGDVASELDEEERFQEVSVATGDARSLFQLRVDRRLSDCESTQQQLLYYLVHRLEIHELYTVGEPDVEPSTLSYEDQLDAILGLSSECESFTVVSHEHKSVFAAAVELLTSLDVAAQAEVCRLILDRRLLVPWRIQANELAPNTLCCSTATLQLVDTAIDFTKGYMRRAALATDTDYLRVAVVSELASSESKARRWIKDVFHVDSLYAIDSDKQARSTTVTAAIEIGWGFIQSRDLSYVPVVLLHVIGQPDRFRSLIESYCDIIMAEVGSGGLCSLSADKGTLVKWNFKDPPSRPQRQVEGARTVISLSCPYRECVSTITQLLRMTGKRSPRASLASVMQSEVDENPFVYAHLPSDIVFARLRKKQFPLQNAFAISSGLRIKCQQTTDKDELLRLQAERREADELRAQLATKVEKENKLLWHFLEILSLSSSDRVVAVLGLERCLAEQSEVHGEQPRRRYREAHDAWVAAKEATKNDPQRTGAVDRARSALVTAEMEWDMATVSLEHLWRELSHLYVANNKKWAYLPWHAARHLLAGFSIELMDGDASMINVVWIQSVLRALQHHLGDARLLVVSVMGKQSTGKSTLLNYMFGVRLSTRVSRCTRGVNMQVLKCEGRDDYYDYVVLLDTEGICAPEFEGQLDSTWRDNRMATLAILPADVTIVLMGGEDTGTVKDILPVVLSAYLGMEVATDAQLPAQLLYVFNRIDTSEKSNLERMKNSLMASLEASFNDAVAVHRGATTLNDDDALRAAVSTTSSAFSRQQVEERVHVFGVIKRGHLPPEDTLEREYGRGIVELRKRVDDVVAQPGWRGRTIKELSDYLVDMWGCVEKANFYLSFKTMLERKNHDALAEAIGGCEQQLSSAYYDAFTEISTTIDQWTDENEGNTSETAELSRKFCNNLADAVAPTMHTLDQRVEHILNDSRFRQFKLLRRETWRLYTAKQEIHWEKLVRDKVDVVFTYVARELHFKRVLYAEANKLFESEEWKRMAEVEKDRAFDKTFQAIIDLANAEHKPVHTSVIASVDRIFRESPRTRFIMDDDESWMVATGRKTRRAAATAAASDESWMVATQRKARRVVASIFHGRNPALVRENHVRQIKDAVTTSIKGVKRYEDRWVRDCIEHTEVRLVKVKADMDLKREVYTWLIAYLSEQLREIQRQWDMKHCVPTRLESCKDDMRKYFELVKKGFQGAELLRETMDSVLRQYLQDAFEEQLATHVYHAVKEKKWVTSDTMMQAFMDRDLIRLIKAGNIGNVLSNIAHPSPHMQCVISGLVNAKAVQCMAKFRSDFFKTIRTCVREAALAAYDAEGSSSKMFVDTLSEKLSHRLSSAAAMCIKTKLPAADAITCNRDAFREAEGAETETVLSRMLRTLDELESQQASYSSSELSRRIAEHFTDFANGVNEGVQLRCGEPCPRCKLPCTRTKGHAADGHDEAARLHDTFHQPSGLVGISWAGSDELAEYVCCNDDTKFLHEGEWVPYRDFRKVFPSWCQPKEKEKTVSLPLREYIFYNYQAELVARFSRRQVKPCTNRPSSYNRELSVIEERINDLCRPEE